ncbi:hypothetical protein JVT61DRAFT_15411 [Boletus reticuloceps]|uniref:Uncharacterized protein n=1 Tax=Boletus reticuloceps TaxID=495285 RepID=A0A8I2YVE3_9AGAM|nr:hypothetical protein JVT61DRAFT_15411 [Boletus reticuloceps]
MQSSSATSSTPHFTHPRRTDAPGCNYHRNYGTAPRVTTHSKTLRSAAKPIQPAPNREFHLDTFFNPVWMSGPHVFSYAKDGRVVRPETHQVEPYPGYNAASSNPSPSTSTSWPRADPSKPSARIQKPWKNVAITEQDDADFVAMQAEAKVRARAEARAKLVGLVYTWPPKPQAAACAECEVLAVGTRVGPGTVVGPQVQLSAGTDTQESVVPALSYGSSGESESESEVFKVGRSVVGRREDQIEKYVGFGRVKTSAPLVLEGVEEGEGVNGRSKVDDDVWNPVVPETWVEDELTVRLKAILRMPDN